jgi:hypothetical protein
MHAYMYFERKAKGAPANSVALEKEEDGPTHNTKGGHRSRSKQSTVARSQTDRRCKDDVDDWMWNQGTKQQQGISNVCALLTEAAS